jgi:Na+/melibiose symporter-like transporter
VLLGSLALTYLGFSAASIAYQAWGADIGTDSRLRTRLTAAREGFGLVGVVLAAVLPTVLAADSSEGIARLSWVLPPLLLCAAATTFSLVRAPHPMPVAREPLLASLRPGCDPASGASSASSS